MTGDRSQAESAAFAFAGSPRPRGLPRPKGAGWDPGAHDGPVPPCGAGSSGAVLPVLLLPTASVALLLVPVLGSLGGVLLFTGLTLVSLAVGGWCLRLRARCRGTERERDLHASLFHYHREAAALVDSQGVIRRANPAFSRLAGRPASRLEGTPFVDLLAPSDRTPILGAIRGAMGGKPGGSEAALRPEEGERLQVEITTIPAAEGEEVVGAFQLVRDVTRRKEIEKKLQDRALHDPLTGLPNRALFQDRIGHAMQRVRRHGGRMALLYLDLDGFKEVNDTEGHAIGDRLLDGVSARLSCFMREGDTVARLGGDEFAVLLEKVEGEGDAVTAAERVVELLDDPFRIEGREIEVGASVGVALSSPDLEDVEALVRQADRAMYEAKRHGGHGHCVYRDELERAALSPDRVTEELSRALDSDQLLLHYQPIVDLAGTKIVGVEALVRWRHPERGILLPSAFLSVAEESGLIAYLDRWVLRRGCADVKAWMDGGLVDDGPFFLSVNLSTGLLEEADLSGSISAALEEEDFPAHRLQVELAERDAVGSEEKVRILKSLGLRVALDEFGTASSSLGYLRDLEVDVLKVDRSFAQVLAAEQTSVAVIRTALTLAELLGLEVIVEGVEEPTQLRRLQDLGGRLVQGFYFGSPVEARELRDLLRRGLPPSWAWRPGTGIGAGRRGRGPGDPIRRR